VALRDALPVVGRPAAGSRKLGELLAGAVVPRSTEPYGRDGCDGGFYAVRPRGFVCVGDGASLEVRLRTTPPALPALARPLPYRYARARTEGVPLYQRVPSPAEQLAAEPQLAKHLAARAELEKELWGASANDVPIDERGVATGPAVILPGAEGVASGRRTTGRFFAFPVPDLSPPSPAGREAAPPAVLHKASGIALTGTFSADSGSGPRRFGLLPSGRVVPTDRLKPALGSTVRGIDLTKAGLPVAFVHHPFTHAYSVHAGKSRRLDEDLERRTAVFLTGKYRTSMGDRYEQTRDDIWLKTDDLIVVVRRTKMPEFAKDAQKWLDVSLANQTVTLYEGTRPIYAALISSGRDVLKDPATSASTIRGTFRVRSKYVTRRFDPRELAGEIEIQDAPWVLEFEPGYVIAGSYFSDAFGEAQNYHAITLSPIDARRIWSWADPQVPDGWSGVEDDGTTGTIVYIRP
jgi:hypothetical protein